MERVKIIINSSNRAGKVKTHELFPEGTDYQIAVPFDQYWDYLEHHEKPNLLRIPDNVKQYLSSQRQFIMETFVTSSSYDYVWLMDDDLSFFRRSRDMKLEKCITEDIESMFELIQSTLQEFPMVGISTRLGNNRVTEDYADTTRVTRCYALSTNVFKEVGATFAPFEPFLAQDFHMTLCWLNAGHNNRVLYTYAQEDVGSNAEGGVSSYRDPELLKKVSIWMAENHPEVTWKAKKSDSWEGFGDYRIDMVIQWKRAYKPKVKVTGGLIDRIRKRSKNR